MQPIKMHLQCESCQCYPECRNDCPDFPKCAVRLGYAKTESEAMMQCIDFLRDQRDEYWRLYMVERDKTLWQKFKEKL